MSNFGFGEDDIEQGEPQIQDSQGPKWFREHMDKVSGQLKALQERNDALEQAQRQSQVQEALKAKGYAPQAAGLYTGTPDKLDDWLSANGAALAKTDGSAVELGQGVQGTPQTVVSAESQAAQAQFSSAGSDGASPALGSEAQLNARIDAAVTEEEFNAVMRDAGNPRF